MTRGQGAGASAAKSAGKPEQVEEPDADVEPDAEEPVAAAPGQKGRCDKKRPLVQFATQSLTHHGAQEEAAMARLLEDRERADEDERAKALAAAEKKIEEQPKRKMSDESTKEPPSKQWKKLKAVDQSDTRVGPLPSEWLGDESTARSGMVVFW